MTFSPPVYKCYLYISISLGSSFLSEMLCAFSVVSLAHSLLDLPLNISYFDMIVNSQGFFSVSDCSLLVQRNTIDFWNWSSIMHSLISSSALNVDSIRLFHIDGHVPMHKDSFPSVYNACLLYLLSAIFRVWNIQYNVE